MLTMNNDVVRKLALSARINEINKTLFSEANCMNSEHRDLLRAIKSASEKITFEITGGAAVHDEERLGLADNNSLKQVLEEILHQMKIMNANIEAQSSRLEESLKVQEKSQKQGIQDLKGSKQRIAEFPVVKVHFPTKLSWNSYWISKVARMQNKLRIPINGQSLKGKTLTQLAQSIPRPNKQEDILELAASLRRGHIPPNCTDLMSTGPLDRSSASTNMAMKIINRHVKERNPILIEFCNHSDFPLQRPQLFLHIGSVFRGMSKVVIPGARDVTCVYTGIYDERVQGLLSYEVQTKDTRLTVRLDYRQASRYRKFEIFCGLAFVPTDVPVDITMFAKEVPEIPAMDFNFDKEDGCWKVVQSKNLIAASTVTVEDSYIVLKIQLLKNIQKPSVELEMKSVSDGYTIPEPSFDWDALFGAQVGCVVEIENRLNIMLQEFQEHIETPSQFVLLPRTISNFTREMFYVLSDCSTKGMVSHKIENTDLRLAVVFWTESACNLFAVGFFSQDSPTNAATIDSLRTSEHWKTRPYLLADAKEGEQVLEYRNFRVTASMSADVKAILKIIITAF